METHELITRIDDSLTSLEAFKKRQDERLGKLEDNVRAMETKAARPNFGGQDAPIEMWTDVKTGRPIPILEHKQSLASLEASPTKNDKGLPPSSDVKTLPSMGRVLRGLILGGRAPDARELEEERKSLGFGDNTAGGYTVPSILSAQWIDLLRAKMVLSQAGARTVPMDSKTLTMARVTGDPTTTWHPENASISAGDPTFGAVTLDAKTCVCMVKLSLELSQDSVNIDSILQTTITQSMAHAIDSAGLIGVTTNAGAAPGGIFNATGRSKATGIGAPTNWDFLVDALYTLQASNVPLENIGAFIAHPALWKKMRKLKTGLSGDQTSLVPPPEVANLPKLWTTAAPFTSGTTCSGVLGDWSQYMFGVRRNIEVRFLNEVFLGSNLQVAVLAYARVDFLATRADNFYTAEGVTVS
jgi:HK97 family phage major capsid protein